MKLKIFNFGTELDLSTNLINVLEVKDILLFRKIIETLQSQIINREVEEKVYVYNDDFKEINYRNIELIANYLDLFSNLKVANELEKILNNEFDEQKELMLQDINIEFNNLATHLFYDIDLDISYKDSFELKDFLRILKVEINNNGSIVDNLFSLLEYYSLITSDKLLFLVNLKLYLEKDELLEFYRYIIANELKVVLLEGKASNEILENEQKLLIDSNFEDYFELYTPEI